MGQIVRKSYAYKGQSTVEAAFVLPIVMLLALLLLQPAIILYDRIVMTNAAAEACRLLVTLSADDSSSCEMFIRHRLAAIPEQDLFHVHHGEQCSWLIEISGNESTPEVSVVLTNQIKPLPLIDITTRLVNATNEQGNLEIRVSETFSTQPAWAV